MGLFQRKPRDLIGAEALAQFGRFELLGSELSGVSDPSAALSLLEPLRSRGYGDAREQALALDEIRRHAGEGDWEAVGAWKYSQSFGPTPEFESEMMDVGLNALRRMRITNLDIHLPPACQRRYEELFGEQAPYDGFFGPPTFDSDFGPSRQYYFDAAVSASMARCPPRLSYVPEVAPPDVAAVVGVCWDFGMLVLRGPLVVPPDVRFEPAVVRPAVEAANGVDHRMFAAQLSTALSAHVADRADLFNGWPYIGAARFLEDYLDPSLQYGDVHTQLIDTGLDELRRYKMIDVMFPSAAFSDFERSRL